MSKEEKKCCLICRLPVRDEPPYSQPYFECVRCGHYTVARLGVMQEAMKRFCSLQKEIALLSHYVRENEYKVDLWSIFHDNTLHDIIEAELPTLDWQVKEAMLCLWRHIKDKPRSEAVAFQMDEFCDIYKLGIEGKCTSGDLTKDGFKLCFEVMARAKALFPEDVKYLVADVLEKELGYLDVIKSRKPSHTDVPSLMNDITKVRITPKGWRYIEGTLSNVNSKDVFIAMWFDDYTKPLRESIRKTVKESGYDAFFVDEIYNERPKDYEKQKELEKNETIDNMMIAGLRRAKFVIADLTCLPDLKAEYTNDKGEKKTRDVVCAGAYFEAGFASGLDKVVIYTVQKGQEPHFDVNHIPCIRWEFDKLKVFEEELKRTIEARIINLNN